MVNSIYLRKSDILSIYKEIDKKYIEIYKGLNIEVRRNFNPNDDSEINFNKVYNDKNNNDIKFHRDDI